MKSLETPDLRNAEFTLSNAVVSKQLSDETSSLLFTGSVKKENCKSKDNSVFPPHVTVMRSLFEHQFSLHRCLCVEKSYATTVSVSAQNQVTVFPPCRCTECPRVNLTDRWGSEGRLAVGCLVKHTLLCSANHP